MRHDKIEAISSLEEVLHTAQVRMLNPEHDVHFVESAHDLVRIDKFVLSDTFDGIQFSCVTKFSEINATKGAAA